MLVSWSKIERMNVTDRRLENTTQDIILKENCDDFKQIFDKS